MSDFGDRVAAAKELASIDQKMFQIKVTVEFGEAFLGAKTVTKAELLVLIRDQVANHPASMMTQSISLVADYLEYAIASKGAGAELADQRMTATFMKCPDCMFGSAYGQTLIMDQTAACLLC